MPDWLLRFLTWLTKKSGDDLRANFVTLTKAYDDLMERHERLTQGALSRIDTLEKRVESQGVEIERERTQHADCRRKLHEHEADIKHLKAQMQVIQRTQDGTP